MKYLQDFPSTNARIITTLFLATVTVFGTVFLGEGKGPDEGQLYALTFLILGLSASDTVQFIGKRKTQFKPSDKEKGDES